MCLVINNCLTTNVIVTNFRT